MGTLNGFQEPAGGRRDALVHVVEGGLYPYAPDTGTPYPVTSDPLPALALFPAVVLSGLARYEGAVCPEEFRGRLFSAQHIARRGVAHTLRREGSTYRSSESDFVTRDDPDFHPSDVLEAPDGSLIAERPRSSPPSGKRSRRIPIGSSNTPWSTRSTGSSTRRRSRKRSAGPARGREVFFAPPGRLRGLPRGWGPEGSRVGPDLTRIGAVRAGRDLLESILLPSSTFAQGYEPYVARAEDGEVFSGLRARQTEEAVVLRDAAGTEIALPRRRPRDLRRGSVSVMPEGLERNLSEAEFRDLLAFLRSLR